MFKTFEEFCRYYSHRDECRIECPYYNCEDKISCEENYNIDKIKPITRLDMLIEVEEIKDMIRQSITARSVSDCFNIKNIVDQMNKEYNSIEKQLDKISKSIFTIHKDTDLISHEIMELSTELENLGISLNELNERGWYYEKNNYTSNSNIKYYYIRD